MVSPPRENAFKVLFDTNILIDHLGGIRQASIELDRYADRTISLITWIEVMAGTSDEDEEEIRAILRRFRVLAITSEVAEAAFVLRRRGKIKVPDAIILATAIVEGRRLVTRNTRDFPASDPSILIPYSL